MKTLHVEAERAVRDAFNRVDNAANLLMDLPPEERALAGAALQEVGLALCHSAEGRIREAEDHNRGWVDGAELVIRRCSRAGAR